MPNTLDSVQRRRYPVRQPYQAAPRSQAVYRARRPKRHWLRWSLAITLIALGFVYGPGLLHTKTLGFSRIFGISIAAADPKSEGEVVAQTTKFKPDQKVQAILDTYQQTTGATSGVVVYDLDRQSVASIGADSPYFPASIYKLFVAERLYALRAAGKLDFAKKITITSKAAAQDAGTLIWPVGMKVTVSQCLERMIQISDNTCGSLLGGLVGWAQADGALKGFGYSQTTLDNSLTANKDLTQLKTSARDVANLLAAVSEGAMVDKASSAELLNLLQGQKINGRLSGQLPKGVLAHKTGDYAGYFHDAGIVNSGGHTYVISVLSGPWNSQKTADAAISELSRDVYDAILAR